MKIALRLTFCALLPMLSFAQIPDTIWARTVGGQNSDMGECIQLTSDSCLIIAGQTQSFGPGGSDFYLIKMDVNGDTLWTRVHGTPDHDACYHVLETPDRGFLMTGVSNSSLYLIKTDSLGYSEWLKLYANGYDCIGYGACPTSDNGYIITGHCQGPIGCLWLLKIDSLGDTVWTGCYGFASGDDWGHEVIEVPDGYMVVGTSMHTGADLYLLKTDFSGVQQWEKWYGTYSHDVGYSIVPTYDNCYFVVGIVGSAQMNAWVLKISNTGDTLWTRMYGGYGIDYGIDIVSTEADSGFIITGETALIDAPADLFVLKCNAHGDSVWLRTYGGYNLPDGPESMIKMYDGGFAICGYTRSFGAGGYDVWVLRMSGETGLAEERYNPSSQQPAITTIWAGPLVFPQLVEYIIYDITGRQVYGNNPSPGIYYLVKNSRITQKIIKIK